TRPAPPLHCVHRDSYASPVVPRRILALEVFRYVVDVRRQTTPRLHPVRTIWLITKRNLRSVFVFLSHLLQCLHASVYAANSHCVKSRARNRDIPLLLGAVSHLQFPDANPHATTSIVVATRRSFR